MLVPTSQFMDKIRLQLLADPAVRSVKIQPVCLIRVTTTMRENADEEDRARVYEIERELIRDARGWSLDFYVTVGRR